ncbi:hypothetical protein QBC38DRAFT_525213, partial [Podospora fimiseda]
TRHQIPKAGLGHRAIQVLPSLPTKDGTPPPHSPRTKKRHLTHPVINLNLWSACPLCRASNCGTMVHHFQPISILQNADSRRGTDSWVLKTMVDVWAPEGLVVDESCIAGCRQWTCILLSARTSFPPRFSSFARKLTLQGCGADSNLPSFGETFKNKEVICLVQMDQRRKLLEQLAPGVAANQTVPGSRVPPRQKPGCHGVGVIPDLFLRKREP